MRMRQGMMVATLVLLAACGPQKTAQQAAPEQPAASRAAAVVAGTERRPERRIVALGDSLFAGYGLQSREAYPVRLEAALRARGLNVRVTNAGVSGDTTADGAARLDFTLASLPRAPDLVLISLGGNDMLRGLPPAATRANLDAILGKLAQRRIPVVVMGMLAAPNMGKAYAGAFNSAFPQMAHKHKAVLVPFFLAATLGRADLTQADHLHPTGAGVEAIVAATVDQVAKALPQALPQAPAQ